MKTKKTICPKCKKVIDISHQGEMMINLGKSQALTEIDNELRGLYFLVTKGHDERIQAQINVLERIKTKLQEQNHSQTEQSEGDGCLRDNSLSKSDSPPQEIK